MTLYLILFPLLSCIVLFALKPANSKVWALAASLIELVISLVVVTQFIKDESVQFITDVPWINSMGLRFSVGIDGISLLLVLLTTVLVPFIILSSFKHEYSKPSTFYGLILMMQMALIGVFTSLDGLLFYLFWEVALIPIYFICLIWGGKIVARSR